MGSRRGKRQWIGENRPLQFTNTISSFIQDLNWPESGQNLYTNRQPFQHVPHIPGNEVTMCSDTGNNGQWHQQPYHNQNQSYGNSWFRPRYHPPWQPRPYRPPQPRFPYNNVNNNNFRNYNNAINTKEAVRQSNVKKTPIEKVQKPDEKPQSIKPVENKAKILEKSAQKTDGNKAESDNPELKSAETNAEVQTAASKPKEVKPVESEPQKSEQKPSDKPKITTEILKLIPVEAEENQTTEEKCHEPKSINDKQYVNQVDDQKKNEIVLKEVAIVLSRDLADANIVAYSEETKVEEKKEDLEEDELSDQDTLILSDEMSDAESPIRNVRVHRRIYDSDEETLFGGIDTAETYLTDINSKRKYNNNDESPTKKIKTEETNMYDKIKMKPRVNNNDDDLLNLLIEHQTEQMRPSHKIRKNCKPEESIKRIIEELRKALSSSSSSSIKKDHQIHSSSSIYKCNKRRASHDSQKNKNKSKEKDLKHTNDKNNSDKPKKDKKKLKTSKKLQLKRRSFELFGSPDEEFKKLDDSRKKAAKVALQIKAKSKIASQNVENAVEKPDKEFKKLDDSRKKAAKVALQSEDKTKIGSPNWENAVERFTKTDESQKKAAKGSIQIKDKTKLASPSCENALERFTKESKLKKTDEKLNKVDDRQKKASKETLQIVAKTKIASQNCENAVEHFTKELQLEKPDDSRKKAAQVALQTEADTKIASQNCVNAVGWFTKESKVKKTDEKLKKVDDIQKKPSKVDLQIEAKPKIGLQNCENAVEHYTKELQLEKPDDIRKKAAQTEAETKIASQNCENAARRFTKELLVEKTDDELKKVDDSRKKAAQVAVKIKSKTKIASQDCENAPELQVDKPGDSRKNGANVDFEFENKAKIALQYCENAADRVTKQLHVEKSVDSGKKGAQVASQIEAKTKIASQYYENAVELQVEKPEDDIQNKAAEVALQIKAKTKKASQYFDIMVERFTKDLQVEKPVYETASPHLEPVCMNGHEIVPPLDIYRTLTKTQVVNVNVKKDAKVEIDIIDLTEEDDKSAVAKTSCNRSESPLPSTTLGEGLTLYRSPETINTSLECQATEASIIPTSLINTLLEIAGNVEPCTQASVSITPIENTSVESARIPPVKVVSDLTITPIPDKLSSLVNDLQLLPNDTQSKPTTMLQSLLAQKTPKQQNKPVLFSNIPSPSRVSSIPDGPPLLAPIPPNELEKPDVEREIATTFAPLLSFLNGPNVSRDLLENVSYNIHMASLLHEDWPMDFDFQKVVSEVRLIFVNKYKRNDCVVMDVLDKFFNVVKSMPESVPRTPWINKFRYLVVSSKNYVVKRTLQLINASSSMTNEQRYTLQHQIKAYNHLVQITNQAKSTHDSIKHLQTLTNTMTPQTFNRSSLNGQQILMRSPQQLYGGQVLSGNVNQQGQMLQLNGQQFNSPNQQSGQLINQNQLAVQQVFQNPVQMQQLMQTNQNQHRIQVVGNTVHHYGLQQTQQMLMSDQSIRSPNGANQHILRSPHPNQSPNFVQSSKSPRDQTRRRKSAEKTPRRRVSTDNCNLRQTALLQSISQQNMPRPNIAAISTTNNTPVYIHNSTPHPYNRLAGPPEAPPLRATISLSPPCKAKSPVYAPIIRVPNQFESSDVEDTSPTCDNFRIRLPYSRPYNEIQHKSMPSLDEGTGSDKEPAPEAEVKEELMPIKVEDFGAGTVFDVDKDWLDDLVFPALDIIKLDEDEEEEITGRNANSSPADSGCDSPHQGELLDIQDRICLCGESAQFLCTNCMLVMYCSVKCQLNHWSVHRTICQSRAKTG
ncbi:unnamed protein product [Brassicogethes aeneus]|uniref:MYND-type domain-containing protein n=1 Tax=Brassicogethes aeneus TaxID=1431903 RepID=A0A9P0BK62_BRAAE|nr:unnamed protein product [Brassicogethes aeneus]